MPFAESTKNAFFFRREETLRNAENATLIVYVVRRFSLSAYATTYYKFVEPFRCLIYPNHLRRRRCPCRRRREVFIREYVGALAEECIASAFYCTV
jgi:hypothetical protein